MTSMPEAPESIRRFYDDWTQYLSRLVDAVRDLTADQLAMSAGPDHAPIGGDDGCARSANLMAEPKRTAFRAALKPNGLAPTV